MISEIILGYFSNQLVLLRLAYATNLRFITDNILLQNAKLNFELNLVKNLNNLFPIESNMLSEGNDFHNLNWRWLILQVQRKLSNSYSSFK